MRLPKTSLSLIALLPMVASCGDFWAESTGREILKLAYRSGQFQVALERCDVDEKAVSDYSARWNRNFDAAGVWLGLARETFTERQVAGREALGEDVELGCDVIGKAFPLALSLADRWHARINAREYCGPLGCD